MIESWRAQERRYEIDKTLLTFTKIEIPSWRDTEGKVQGPWMSRERLKNEHAVLKFILEKTTIPVPKPLRLESLDGCLALSTEWIDGVPFDDLEPEIRSEAYLDEYVRTCVLPQLRELTSSTSGAIHGVILPPRRLFDRYPQRQWLPRLSEGLGYHLNHCDLSQHNFLCDRGTGKVKAVIDWEFAGFYPSYFEAPLWSKPHDEIEDDPEEIGALLEFLEMRSPRSTESSMSSFTSEEALHGSLPGRKP